MSAKRWLTVVIPMGLLFGMAVGWLTAGATTKIEPRFKQSPQGWLPSCPAGMAIIRHYPPPDCFWGLAPMSQKPTAGDMECVPTATMPKLPACPAE